MHALHARLPRHFVLEERLSAQGATVYAVEAMPQTSPIPTCVEQTESMSLIDYLPADLDAMAATYVPHGMQGTVINLRNQRLKAGHGHPPTNVRPHSVPGPAR